MFQNRPRFADLAGMLSAFGLTAKLWEKVKYRMPEPDSELGLYDLKEVEAAFDKRLYSSVDALCDLALVLIRLRKPKILKDLVSLHPLLTYQSVQRLVDLGLVEKLDIGKGNGSKKPVLTEAGLARVEELLGRG